ncbi:MAG: co-chaperone DjlA [Xanthomonadales bacterium]|nr:co-chaperone DjlA [Xanthomonadales bacterium]
MIGKIVGIALGLVLIHGWPGFFIGLLLGHVYDRAVARLREPSIGHAFIEPLFAFAGALAKADGRVSEPEITAAEALMTRFGLDAEQRRLAVEHFTAGKQPGFDVGPAIAALRTWCHGRGDRALAVLDPLIDLVYADGPLPAAKRDLVRRLCAALGLAEATFDWLATMKGYAPAQAGARRQRANGGGWAGSAPPPAGPAALDPYGVLGVARGADERTLKQAYRKLISQNHPDKLGNVPDELKRRAERRAVEINAAWERIKAERGFK